MSKANPVLSYGQLALLKSTQKKLKQLNEDIGAIDTIIRYLIDEPAITPKALSTLYSAESEAQFNEVLIKIFKDAGAPIDLDSLLAIIKKEYGFLIPIQVLDERSFLRRKLNKACKENVLFEMNPQAGRKSMIYMLPSA